MRERKGKACLRSHGKKQVQDGTDRRRTVADIRLAIHGFRSLNGATNLKTCCVDAGSWCPREQITAIARRSKRRSITRLNGWMVGMSSAQKVVECAECGLMERRDMIRRHGWLICADGVLLCSFQCQCDYRSKKRTEMRELFGTGGKETQCKTMNG